MPAYPFVPKSNRYLEAGKPRGGRTLALFEALQQFADVGDSLPTLLAQPLGSFLSELGRSLRVRDIVAELQHEVLEVNDQEVTFRCMPHERGVFLVLWDDDGYSHGGRVPETGLSHSPSEGHPQAGLVPMHRDALYAGCDQKAD